MSFEIHPRIMREGYSRSTFLGRGVANPLQVGDTVAIGYKSLANVTTGGFNTAVGYQSMTTNTTGRYNTAVGLYSLKAGVSAWESAAFGSFALESLVSGYYNSAFGAQALGDCTTGGNNTASGYQALGVLTTGNNNVGIGYSAGRKLGGVNLTTGSNNIIIGYYSQSSSASVSNTVTLGNSSIATLRCQVTSITALSDERDKSNINTSEYGLELVKMLRPVTFEWNMRDGGKVGQKDLGFIAQDLVTVEDALDAHDTLALTYRDNPDKLEASYGRLVPVLVKAMQELAERVEQLEGR